MGDIVFDDTYTTLYMEVICTFVFVLFILHVTGKHTEGPDMGVWGVPAICLVLWALTNVDSFTGASFNPALAIGSTFAQSWWFASNPQGILSHYLPMYAGGAALGGILAGVFYNFHEKLFIRHDEHQHQLHHTTDSINPEHERKHSH